MSDANADQFKEEKELGSSFLKNQFEKFFLTSEKSAKNIAESFKKLILTVQDNPDGFSFTEIGRASSTRTSKANKNSPELTFENPLDEQVTIKEISYIPDAVFKTDGMVSVTVDDAELFKNKAVGDFTNVVDAKIPVPEGKTIKRKGKLKVFIWNGTDTDAVALTVQVTFGESKAK